MSQDSLAAVRERLADLRKSAAVMRKAQRYVSAADIEWAANALEAVLEAAPCEAPVRGSKVKGFPCELKWDSPVHKGSDMIGCPAHNYMVPWLEAALTRATATTEGAR